jgi:TrmH family RNA methyltransferase
VITSRDNDRLKLLRKLQHRRWRDKLGLFVAEGEDVVDAARAAGLEPVELLAAGETVEASLLAEVSTLAHPPRVVAVFRRDDLPRGTRPATLALWHVADPGNLGALLRSADAFGAGVALSPGCADPTGPKALRASMGALFRVPLGAFDEPAGRRVALVPRGGTPLPEVDLSGEVVLVLGAERAGLPDDVLERCDVRATIPHGRRRRRKRPAPVSRGRTRDSPSRFRFRPPRPTGLPPRGCPLLVEPLGRGLDLVACRARRKQQPTPFSPAVQENA